MSNGPFSWVEGIIFPGGVMGDLEASVSGSVTWRLRQIEQGLGSLTPGSVTNNYTTDPSGTNSRLDTVHADLVSNGQKLDTVHQDLSGTNSRLDTLHGDQVSQGTKLDTLHGDFVVNQGKLDTIAANTSGTQGRLDTVHSDLVSNGQKLDTVHSDLSGTNTKLDTLHADQVVVQGKLDTLGTNTSGTQGRLDTLHSDMQANGVKLDTVHTDLSGTNVKLDTLHADQLVVQSKLDTVASNTSGTQGRLDTLHADMGTNGAKLDTLHADLSGTNVKLDTVHTDQLGVQSRLDTISANTSGTGGKLDTIHSDFVSNNTKLDTLHADLSGTNSRLDLTHADLGTLHQDMLNNTAQVAANGSLISGTNVKLDVVHADQLSVQTKLDTIHADLLAPTPSGTNNIGLTTEAAFTASVSGTLATSNAAVTINVPASKSQGFIVKMSATPGFGWANPVTFEGSMDGTTWVQLPAYGMPTGGTANAVPKMATDASGGYTGVYVGPLVGFTQFRVKCGTIAIGSLDVIVYLTGNSSYNWGAMGIDSRYNAVSLSLASFPGVSATVPNYVSMDAANNSPVMGGTSSITVNGGTVTFFNTSSNKAYPSMVINISNNWVGTIVVEGCIGPGGSTWVPMNCRMTKLDGTVSYGSVMTNAVAGQGSYLVQLNMAQCTGVRVRATTLTSGTVDTYLVGGMLLNSLYHLGAGTTTTEPMYVQVDGTRGSGINQIPGATGAAGDLSMLVLNSDPGKPRTSKAGFQSGFTSVTPIAIANGVYSWKSLQAWQIPNTNPYYWFLARGFSAYASGANVVIRAGEKCRLGTWQANNTANGTFTQNATGLNQGDYWSDAWFEVITSTGATARTYTITFVDEQGNTHSPTVTVPTNTLAGTRFPITPDAFGNLGLISITNITCSTNPGATGLMNVFGFKTFSLHGTQTGAGGGTYLIDELCIGHFASAVDRFAAIEYTAASTTAVTIWGTIMGKWTTNIYVE